MTGEVSVPAALLLEARVPSVSADLRAVSEFELVEPVEAAEQVFPGSREPGQDLSVEPEAAVDLEY